MEKVQERALLQLKSLEEMLKYLGRMDTTRAIECTVKSLKEQFAKYLEELDKEFEQRLKVNELQYWMELMMVFSSTRNSLLLRNLCSSRKGKTVYLFLGGFGEAESRNAGTTGERNTASKIRNEAYDATEDGRIDKSYSYKNNCTICRSFGTTIPKMAPALQTSHAVCGQFQILT